MSAIKGKGEAAMQEVIKMLLEAGWEQDGQTAQQMVRIPTTDYPVYGGIGGKLVKTGGRLRLCLPGTDYRVTVGKITTYFYQVPNGVTQTLAHLQTRHQQVEIEAMIALIQRKRETAQP